ncbi:hypothetical protein Plhal304r1_c011g0043661 [Plasmopara halstedii]
MSSLKLILQHWVNQLKRPHTGDAVAIRESDGSGSRQEKDTRARHPQRVIDNGVSNCYY